jgi:hypothetical protein
LEDLIEERRTLRAHIVQLFTDFKYQAAVIPCKRVVQVSQAVYERVSRTDSLYEWFGDQLLQVKVFIKLDKMKKARELLTIVWEDANSKLDDSRLVLRKDALELVRQQGEQ